MVKTNQKETNSNVQQAINNIAVDVFEKLIPEQEQQQIFSQTMQLLANGRPVPPGEIAIRLQVPSDRVISTLQGFGGEFDKDGNIVGVGLTLVPTPHVYEANGQKLYAWCVADVLSFPVLLKHNAHIESPDPVTGEKIRVTVTPERVEKVEPKTAVVTWIKSVDVANVRGSVCHNVHFFRSPETAAKWISTRPGIAFYSANDVYKSFRELYLTRYTDMIAAAQQTKMCC